MIVFCDHFPYSALVVFFDVLKNKRAFCVNKNEVSEMLFLEEFEFQSRL